MDLEKFVTHQLTLVHHLRRFFIMKAIQTISCLTLLALLTWSAPAQDSGQEVVEFEGPDDARLYVMEGEFRQTASMEQNGGTTYYTADMVAAMNVNSGSMTGIGTMLMYGTANSDGLETQFAMDLAMALKAVYKQAGAAVRWSGKAALTGPVSVSSSLGQESANIRGIWTYRDMALDPVTGEQTGTISYAAVATTTYGLRFPFRQPPTLSKIPRATIYSSEGEWRESAGDWSTEITADVYPNGRIKGMGELLVGDPKDPYANVAQKIAGNLNSATGAVTLNGSGTQKTTSRVRVTLNYVNSTGDTVKGKSSVRAYAQRRKF
jgi:hypothetical protein